MRLNPLLYKITLLIFLLATTQQIFSQPEKRLLRHGNREYTDQNFGEAEIDYRRALSSDGNYADAVFNTGDALYNQGKYEEAAKLFQQNFEMDDDNPRKASAMYNMGNSLLKAEKYSESIEAFKNSLRLDPNNMEAKYNLAYAQDMLQQQQNQQQNQQDQQQNNGDQQDQDKKDQQDQDKKDQQDQQNQNQEQQISKEDAERILNSLANDEKEVQDKVNEEKAKAGVIVGSGKNW